MRAHLPLIGLLFSASFDKNNHRTGVSRKGDAGRKGLEWWRRHLIAGQGGAISQICCT